MWKFLFNSNTKKCESTKSNCYTDNICTSEKCCDVYLLINMIIHMQIVIKKITIYYNQ